MFMTSSHLEMWNPIKVIIISIVILMYDTYSITKIKQFRCCWTCCNFCNDNDQEDKDCGQNFIHHFQFVLFCLKVI
ncbi:hypothetical protein C2G38_2080423, partial [Gigaspora rosea]